MMSKINFVVDRDKTINRIIDDFTLIGVTKAHKNC